MKLPKNYIIEDPYKVLVDGGKGSDFRNAVDAVTGGDYAMLAVGKPEYADGSVESVRKAIGAETAKGGLKNYVILTDRPSEWMSCFISNNVIDVRGKTNEQIANDIAWVFSGFGRERNDDPFIIGDSHFWHRNIIRYCGRPWNSGSDDGGNAVVTDDDVVRMNEDMIARWNSAVGADDVVYSIGDFCFGNREKVQSVFDRLNGRKRIVLGNHDRLKFRQYYDIGFERVYDHPVILQQFLILSHQPLEWVSRDGVYGNVYAHVHDNEAYRDFTANTFCASAERIDYTPIRLSEIVRRCQSVSESDCN